MTGLSLASTSARKGTQKSSLPMGTELFLHCHTFISAKSGVLFPLLLFPEAWQLPAPPSPAPALVLEKRGVQGAELDLLHLHSSVLSLQHLGTSQLWQVGLGELCVSITAGVTEPREV